MRGVEASIDLEGLGLSREGRKMICVMLTDPDILIHGTREEFAEFTRRIAEKVEAKDVC